MRKKSMVFVYTAMGVLCVEHANVLELCYIELLSGKGSPYSILSATVMHKQVSGCTVNFGPNFPESPFLELKTRKPPPPPIFRKTSDLGWPKFTPEYPPPPLENFRFGMTKVYSGISPPIWKTSHLG